MWRKCVLILALIASLELQVNGKFHIKPKSHKHKGQWPVDKESRQVKRDTVPAANGYPSYGSQYAAQSSTSYNSAAYNSGNSGQSRSAMPYPASSPSSAPATAAASSSSSSPASATAAAAASPQGGVAATAQAATAPAASPAASAPAPAPAAASPAASPAAASPAPAPAPAAPAPAPAPASLASAPASSTPVEASAPARASVPYTAQASAAYRPSSQSYSYNYNPAPAPYYASYPAPAAYAYPAPAPARSATTLIAAAVAQVAKSTSTQGSAKAHARSNTAGVCIDDERASNFCLKARNPCFCEENHHFMYNYCKDSCNWCDSSENVGHKFWRVVNEAHLPRSWVIENIKFYSDKHAKVPLDTKPTKAFASSSYLGYEPGSAFDNKSSTYWLPNGWYDRGAGEDFIGYEFDQPVAINSVRIIHQKGQGNVVSTKMYVEAADAYGGPYATKWIIENPKGISNKRFNNKMCPLFWRRFSTDQGVYCFKLMTDFNTWHAARDKCAEYGADLASIRGEEEADFVKNQVQLCGFTWIGLNDMKNESNFRWSDGGNLTYKSMSPQMDYIKDERADQEMDCMASDQNGQWTTFHCDDKFYSLCKKKLTAEDEEEEEESDEEEESVVSHHKKYHKAHLKYHTLKKNKVRKHGKKVSLAEELKEAKSNSTEDEEEEQESDEDAIREAVKAQKNSKKEGDEDEDEDEEEEEDSGSGSGRSASTIPDKPSHRSPHKVWEF